MKYCYMFIPLVFTFSACSKSQHATQAQQESKPTQTMNAQVVLKIVVHQDGNIFVNGAQTTLGELPARLAAFKIKNGAIWYYRANPQGEPPPNAMDALKCIMDAKLPVQLFIKEDFSEIATVDGKAQKAADNAKIDAQTLVDAELPFAQQMLAGYSEFFPFGASMALDGKITQQGGYTGSEHPPSQEVIQLLNDAHVKQAKEGSIRACAVVYDVRTVPPGKQKSRMRLR